MPEPTPRNPLRAGVLNPQAQAPGHYRGCIGVYHIGIYRDNGRENGNHYRGYKGAYHIGFRVYLKPEAPES